MTIIAQRENIFLEWLSWHFFEVPKKILKAWLNILRFSLNYFSIPLLIKTFLSPWHQYRWSYGRGFDIAIYLGAFCSNLIFRILGAIFRFFFILIGLFVEALIVLLGFLIFLGWLLMPILLFFGFYHGFRLLV